MVCVCIRTRRRSFAQKGEKETTTKKGRLKRATIGDYAIDPFVDGITKIIET